VIVATWNVNSMGARLGFVLQWLRVRRPDVVCVQELKLEDAAFPHDALAQEGYVAHTHGQLAWNGVGVLVREERFSGEAEVVQRGLVGCEDLGARLVTVRLPSSPGAGPAGDLLVTSVYVPNGKTTSHPDFARKLAFLECLAADVERVHAAHAGPAIVGGDFNLCPEDLDSWDAEGLRGSIFHTDDERARFRAILARGRLIDLFRAKNPGDQTFSWWDYRAGAFHKKMGLRIDFVLGNEATAARTTSVVVEREWRKKKLDLTPSDHAPVVAEIDL
jgi:exodeoxyribonuclease-3